MPVASGYTADVIANGIGSSLVSTNNDVDGVSYAFVEWCPPSLSSQPV
ncbi:hypothetical protein [Chryseobacterium sp. CH1]|nr:hypothetical protein [Chryseobacterium sp. CH1]